jgi:hypothetical protein
MSLGTSPSKLPFSFWKIPSRQAAQQARDEPDATAFEKDDGTNPDDEEFGDQLTVLPIYYYLAATGLEVEAINAVCDDCACFSR